MLEVYYYENSICSERVLMLLLEKHIDDWILHHIHLFKREQFSPEYLKLNPKAQVPTLVYDGQVIHESSIICDFIDDLYPDYPLKPQSRVERALLQEWIKESDDGGYLGIASLSFTAVFRWRLMDDMTPEECEAYWAGQTDVARTHRQRSCVNEGMDSFYAYRAIADWENIFAKAQAALADDREWLMGSQFTLAEVNLAPYIARLDGMQLLDVWLDERPQVRQWWQRVKQRPSFIQSNVGPTPDEAATYAEEGAKVVDKARQRLTEYRTRKSENA